jgi:hypothetical protein
VDFAAIGRGKREEGRCRREDVGGKREEGRGGEGRGERGETSRIVASLRRQKHDVHDASR